MKAGDYIFVYGTLRVGESVDLSQNPGVDYVGPDRINARLFDVGWFPGVSAVNYWIDGASPENPDGACVRGDVFKILNDDVCIGLDHYEGYPSLYDRCQVETEAGVTAWVYTYNGPFTGLEEITSGDWRSYRRNVK